MNSQAWLYIILFLSMWLSSGLFFLVFWWVKPNQQVYVRDITIKVMGAALLGGVVMFLWGWIKFGNKELIENYEALRE